MGRPLPGDRAVSGHAVRFRQAAWAYLAYGVIYWLTALWLQLTVFPVRGRLLVWFGLGALIAVGVPWLLVRPRPWFERWILSRRDVTRILAALVALRAVYVARLAVSGAESLRMPGLGGGVPPSTAGAVLMALVAAATAVMLIRAGWQREPEGERA
ncbi:MAG: hypothetical protein A3D33_07865 [Candidatus Rokubacteria bacterium RIFCSPHIGHO2_02_FULL_73_26]|nr:MAG: hypothetical protein A3D33_07865 [Candidatus Rokubacteria bacterium RIFCSPHIGHO2_02_FULL_73_26]